jgi:hypothetical protein
MARWDSAMTTIPLTPKGLNSWKATSTIVAFASNAAFLRVSCTNCRLPRVLGLHSLNSNSRWVPKACNLFASFSARRSCFPVFRDPASTAFRSRRRVCCQIRIRRDFRRRHHVFNLVCHLSKLILFVKKKSPRASFFSAEMSTRTPHHKMCALFPGPRPKLREGPVMKTRAERGF